MKHNRTIKSYTMRLKGTPEQVFPLLCPVREYEWIETWQCDMVYTESEVAELDCIFKTSFPEDGPEDTWVVSRYERPKTIEFVRVNALRVVHFTILLEREEAGASQWTWKQTITGLIAKGDELVTALQDEMYAAKMGMLEKRLNHFLETGTMLRVVNS
jgi:hypothetical protein